MRGELHAGWVSARPTVARTAGRRACVQSLDRTQRRSRTVRHLSNTVREPGKVAWGQLNRTNTQCVYEIVTGSVFHLVSGGADCR